MSELERKALANDRLVRNGALACVLALAATLLALGMTFYAPGAEGRERAAGSEFQPTADRFSGVDPVHAWPQGEDAEGFNNTYADVSARR